MVEVASHRGGAQPRRNAAALGPARVIRAVAVGSITVALSAAGHLVGGGSLPGPAPLAAVTAAVSVVGFGITGRRLTLVRAGALLMVGQLVLHEIFALLAAHPPPQATLPATHRAHLGHAHPTGASIVLAPPDRTGHLVLDLDAGPAGAIDPTVASGATGHLAHTMLDARMVLGHLGAALLVGAAVAGVDRVAFLLADLWRRSGVLFDARGCPPVGRPNGIAATPFPLPPGWVPRATPARGPPSYDTGTHGVSGRRGQEALFPLGPHGQVARLAA